VPPPAPRPQVSPPAPKREPRPWEEGWEPPARLPSINTGKLLGRLVILVAVLAVLINIPMKGHGVSLARILARHRFDCHTRWAGAQRRRTRDLHAGGQQAALDQLHGRSPTPRADPERRARGGRRVLTQFSTRAILSTSCSSAEAACTSMPGARREALDQGHPDVCGRGVYMGRCAASDLRITAQSSRWTARPGGCRATAQP